MKLQFQLFDNPAHGQQVTPLEGFRYQAGLISPSDEVHLLSHVRDLPFREFEFHGYTGKRRVVSFGWQYDYTGRRLRKVDDIPDFLLGLRELAASFAHLEPLALQQAQVTEYQPGTGIGWHTDKPQFGEVIGVSLLSQCVLRFRRKLRGDLVRGLGGSKQWERVNVLAERCSAYHLSGPARSMWQHSILRVEALRYAITFRNVLESDGARSSTTR